MSYPQRSVFNTSNPDAAWWLVRRVGPDGLARALLAQTDGKTFVRSMQRLLRARIPGEGWIDYGNLLVHGTDVAIDGKWGPVTTRALWAYLHQMGAPQLLLDSVELSAERRAVDRGAVAGAVWLLHRELTGPNEEGGQFGAALGNLYLPPDLIPPTWMRDPTASPGWTDGGTFTLAQLPPESPRPTAWEDTLPAANAEVAPGTTSAPEPAAAPPPIPESDATTTPTPAAETGGATPTPGTTETGTTTPQTGTSPTPGTPGQTIVVQRERTLAGTAQKPGGISPTLILGGVILLAVAAVVTVAAAASRSTTTTATSRTSTSLSRARRARARRRSKARR